MKKINLLVFAFLMAFMGKAQTAANFENLTLATDTFWDGSNLSGGFSSGNAYFLNYYDTTYNYWDGGFIYSNKTDSVTSGYTNNTSAITASGYNGSANYAVANGSSGVQVNLTGSASGGTVKGFYVTNCT
ncbi:MAG TPA: DUF4465 domain-containing protein, partial [Chitinophagales bacterium]|nr:DUF4465 domain-containing protein [Chitinophagales bacterium]